MVLKLTGLINHTKSRVDVVNTNDHSNDYSVDSNETKGHEAWLGGDVSRGIQVWSAIRPACLKLCHMVIYDDNWKMHVLCGNFKSEIAVDDSKDLRVELFDGYAEFHVLNGSAFTDNYVKSRVNFNGQAGTLERRDGTSVRIPVLTAGLGNNPVPDTMSALWSIPIELPGELQEKVERLFKAFLDLEDERLCVVCQIHERGVVLLPCKHLCLCGDCSNEQDLSICPLCRTHVTERLAVFC